MMLEDLSPGMVFHGGPITVLEEEIIAFAQLYDPQPVHTDPVAAAAHPLFQGQCASGWHTAALSMRMMVAAAGHLGWGVVGGGGGELSWARPVRPGDTLRLEAEVQEVTLSRSRPDRGTVVMRNRTFNQRDEEVQVLGVRLVVPRRPHGAG